MSNTDLHSINNIIKTFNEQVSQRDKKLYNYSSTIKDINFLTDYKINNNVKKNLIESVDRDKNVSIISSIINDIDIAIEIEAGIYEFSLVYGSINNLENNIIACVYNDKFNEIISYIDKKSSKYSKHLMKKLNNKNISPQQIAFESPQDIKPENWEKIIKKRDLREYKKNNMAATDLYKCYKCQERRCQVRQMQTRGADEPITNFVTCLNCYHTFKV